MKPLADTVTQALEDIAAADDPAQLDSLRTALIGRKGTITLALRRVGELPPAERKEAGQAANAARVQIERALTARARELEEADGADRLARERIDVTMPGRRPLAGIRHPVTMIRDRIEEIFIGMGFTVAEGPEVETDEHNFEALNIPRDHPARDMQDTFYVTDDLLLRTHTSPVQIRYMRTHAPRLPVRIIAPGVVYRRDDDATHTPMFSQVEGLLLDERVTLGDLRGVLQEFARRMFGDKTEIRIRPSYFPFTEPSVEVDVSCTVCEGAGCRTCQDTGWLEILGAGMVHPRVLASGGYDPERVTGFAFGMGIERVAMLKLGVDDLRLFFDNDIRFLRQAGGVI